MARIGVTLPPEDREGRPLWPKQWVEIPDDLYAAAKADPSLRPEVERQALEILLRQMAKEKGIEPKSGAAEPPDIEPEDLTLLIPGVGAGIKLGKKALGAARTISRIRPFSSGMASDAQRVLDFFNKWGEKAGLQKFKDLADLEVWLGKGGKGMMSFDRKLGMGELEKHVKDPDRLRALMQAYKEAGAGAFGPKGFKTTPGGYKSMRTREEIGGDIESYLRRASSDPKAVENWKKLQSRYHQQETLHQLAQGKGAVGGRWGADFGKLQEAKRGLNIQKGMSKEMLKDIARGRPPVEDAPGRLPFMRARKEELAGGASPGYRVLSGPTGPIGKALHSPYAEALSSALGGGLGGLATRSYIPEVKSEWDRLMEEGGVNQTLEKGISGLGNIGTGVGRKLLGEYLMRWLFGDSGGPVLQPRE